ncbi:NAD(P)H-dependent oxidoreductase [Candidatus Woesearchaeota archaeon]|nr:NAD(P)H-dependent oxidoreductase [Candidatus Woesearchaeota archaeon]
MKALIIYSHPNHKGHNGYILKQVESNLKKSNVDYEVLDLYKLNFNPVLSDDELYTHRGSIKSEETLSYQKLIKKYQNLIFIYPTWWNAMPAILKGFIDKVFTAGFAFKYVGKFPKPLLKGRAVVFTTTGAPSLLYRIFQRGVSIKLISKYTLGFCGIKTKGYSLGSATTLDDKQKVRIENLVNNALRFLK